MTRVIREENRVSGLVATSNISDTTPIVLWADPVTHRLLVNSVNVAVGVTPFRLLSANSTNGTNIKSSSGNLYGWSITNTNASIRYVKVYDKSTTPSVGTDTPILTIMIPGNANGTGNNIFISGGMAFTNGLGIGITTGAPDNDTGAVGANEVIVNMFYN